LIDVTVFDDVSLIPSFWLLGFTKLRDAGKIRLRWRHGRQSPVSGEASKWKSVVFVAREAGRERLGYIDIFDRFHSLDEATITQCDAYFKFNFNADHIKATVAPGLVRKIHPTGFYFPVALEQGVRVPLAVARAAVAGFFARRSSWVERAKDARRSARQRRELDTRYSSLEAYRERLARVTARDLDLFWNVSYWAPKFDTHNVSSNQRVDVMKILEKIRGSSSYRMRFGFVDKPDARAAVPAYVLDPSPSTREYLELLSRTKLSIVTRGLENCFSWRVGEHLALGRFALFERFHNQPLVELRDGHDAVFFEPDLSDLEEKIRWYLDHDHEREAIAARGAAYFDANCLPDRQIASMLATLLT
jgi:hypothetical protein